MSNIERNVRRLALATALAAPATLAAGGNAGAQQAAATPAADAGTPAAPTVVIDGTSIAFDQPPISQAGRIYVPLRGVFERLGASVAFANGQINATAGRHTIGLHVGDTNAVIDGTPRVLESAPIVIAGRVLVPLRFIAEALGATVNFDPRTQTAYITRGAASVAQETYPPSAPYVPTPLPLPPAVTPPPPPPPIVPTGAPVEPPVPSAHLLRVEPAASSVLQRRRPEISASFPDAIDPQSVAIKIDGNDVTQFAFVSERSFSYDPGADLAAGTHTVTVTGNSPSRGSFQTRWTFATVATSNNNFVSGLEPPEGYTVKEPLLISGLTRPNARVHIVATTNDTSEAFNPGDEGAVESTVTADAHGYFEARLDFSDAGSGLLDVRVESTAPGGVAVKTLRLRT